MEGTIGTFYNMDLSLIILSERIQTKNKYTQYGSNNTKSRKCKLMYDDRKQISGCLRQWQDQGKRLQKEQAKTFRVIF